MSGRSSSNFNPDCYPVMDWESDIESDDGETSNMDISSGSSATSYDADSSMRSESPLSVISIDSTMQFFRDDHGRLLNNYSDVYKLPADEEEFERLSKQHDVLARIMGYKYVPGMEEVMADDNPAEPKTCVDFGCGAGSWALDVARDFPACYAVAVDLIPMQERVMPPNLRSEVDDVNRGLHHYFDTFDVAHTRLISAGVIDYHLLVDQLARVVRPGGLIDLCEYDFQAYDPYGNVVAVDEHSSSPPWWAKWLALVRAAVDLQGGDIHAADKLLSWVQRNPAFEGAVYKEFLLPVVPPPRTGRETEREISIEEGQKENCLSFLRAGRPLLLDVGHEEEYLLELEEKVAREIDERKIPQCCRLQCVYARRKMD